ncbi:hypothetical protein DM806_03775 [Sphingobium lactosutens]|nr:hypothetical protein [Sphingobium lactosutens]
MLYRNFAIATLIAAPLIALVAQNFAPRSSVPTEQPSPVAKAPPPSAPATAPIAPPTSFSAISIPSNPEQPMEDARPTLAPGMGLPAAPARSSAMGQSYVPGTAPAGSPNAEP